MTRSEAGKEAKVEGERGVVLHVLLSVICQSTDKMEMGFVSSLCGSVSFAAADLFIVRPVVQVWFQGAPFQFKPEQIGSEERMLRTAFLWPCPSVKSEQRRPLKGAKKKSHMQCDNIQKLILHFGRSSVLN